MKTIIGNAKKSDEFVVGDWRYYIKE